MPLFQFNESNQVSRIRADQFDLEKHLQSLIEVNLPEVFGVQFIASEFAIQGEQPGRIDTIGLDAEGSPTIIEYKRDKNESVINQGLYYMNWLLDHRGDFIIVARDILGQDVEINWNHPRLIIIAQTYAKWDTYAVNRMGEGIELWEYVRYGQDLLYLNQVFGKQRSIPQKAIDTSVNTNVKIDDIVDYTLDYHVSSKPEETIQLFENLRQRIFEFSSDEGEIIETPNKLYISYRHGKNFCEVQIMSRDGLKLHLDISIEELDDPHGFARDVSNVGHWGTGDIEVRLKNTSDFDYVIGLVQQSYRMTL